MSGPALLLLESLHEDARSVLDASATLAWIFADEDNDRAWPIIESLQQFTAFAPAHYPLEVANALLTALRRGRLTPDQAAAAAQRGMVRKGIG